jgi:hypothetical protein
MLTLYSPVTENAWWSVSASTFAAASVKEKYRYTAVGLAMETGTVKVPACRECRRRGTAADIADCKAVVNGRCGRCLWARVGLGKGCPKPPKA